jgi:hypothetical protein
VAGVIHKPAAKSSSWPGLTRPSIAKTLLDDGCAGQARA